MTGACIIDGIDIDQLGMLIVKGGDDDFLTFPERREPTRNDWFEHDGLDVDLTEVYFRDRKLTVKFHISSETANEFLNRLDTFYHRQTY